MHEYRNGEFLVTLTQDFLIEAQPALDDAKGDPDHPLFEVAEKMVWKNPCRIWVSPKTLHTLYEEAEYRSAYVEDDDVRERLYELASAWDAALRRGRFDDMFASHFDLPKYAPPARSH